MRRQGRSASAVSSIADLWLLRRQDYAPQSSSLVGDFDGYGLLKGVARTVGYFHCNFVYVVPVRRPLGLRSWEKLEGE